MNRTTTTRDIDDWKYLSFLRRLFYGWPIDIFKIGGINRGKSGIGCSHCSCYSNYYFYFGSDWVFFRYEWNSYEQIYYCLAMIDSDTANSCRWRAQLSENKTRSSSKTTHSYCDLGRSQKILYGNRFTHSIYSCTASGRLRGSLWHRRLSLADVWWCAVPRSRFRLFESMEFTKSFLNLSKLVVRGNCELNLLPVMSTISPPGLAIVFSVNKSECVNTNFANKKVEK